MPKPKYKPVKVLDSEQTVLRGCLTVLDFLGIEPRRQNTGGMFNAQGRYVSFGTSGDSDINTQFPQGWGWATGKLLLVETKRQGFLPERCYGKARERWKRQVDRLRTCNDNGGVGLWTDDHLWLLNVLMMIRDRGCRVRIGDNEWPVFYLEETTDGTQ